MKLNRTIWLLLILLAVRAATAGEPPGSSAVTSAPAVTKVDPPNWWIGYTPDVMLLLQGRGFQGAQVSTSYPGISVKKTETSANGNYLFVWLRVDPRAREGKAELRVSTPQGGATAELPLLARQQDACCEGFSKDDVIYLIMPDRFADGDRANDRPSGSTGVYDRSKAMAYHGGDLRGVEQHLQYLHDLGVTAIWLTPVWKNTDSDYHGYHVVDFYALDDHMGSMRDYQNLVAAAHKLGIKVLIDFVANHTGPKHPWALDPPTEDWLHGSSSHHLDPVYNFSGLVDPHASPREYRGTLEGWFAGKLPDLNPDQPQLGRYLLQNALWWTEIARLDGFRLDTLPYSSRRFWSSWEEGLTAEYPRITSIGEVVDGDATITSFFQGGRTQYDGVDTRVTTVFDTPLYYAWRDVLLRDKPVQRIIDVLQRDSLYPRPDLLITYIGNHDQKRFMGEEGASKEKLKAAFSLLLTMRGIPELYYADEIGMPGGDDPDNRRDFPGGFPGDAHNAFTDAGRTADEQEIFNHVQALLHLRQQHPALRQGKQWHIAWDDSYYAFVRETPEEKLLVVFNNAAAARQLAVPIDDTCLVKARGFERLFGEGTPETNGATLRVTIPGRSVSIYRVQ